MSTETPTPDPRRLVTCQYNLEPHPIDDECQRVTHAPERQPAYDAVYAVIRRYPPRSADDYNAAVENARVWRAVEAALDAMDLPSRDARVRAEGEERGWHRGFEHARRYPAAPADNPAAASGEETTNPQSLCAHCAATALGYATKGDNRLCHPDDGMDCYRLVTVYNHPMPCPGCCAQRVADVAPNFDVAEEADRG